MSQRFVKNVGLIKPQRFIKLQRNININTTPQNHTLIKVPDGPQRYLNYYALLFGGCGAIYGGSQTIQNIQQYNPNPNPIHYINGVPSIKFDYMMRNTMFIMGGISVGSVGGLLAPITIPLYLMTRE